MVKKIFRVSDMHCPNCATRVESIEDDLPGIKQVSASYKKGQMIVEYDETQVGEAEIVAAVKKAGYQAVLEIPA
jgi:copper chaperone CopZ